MPKPKKALISVSDKTGIIDLAKSLHLHGIEILSTGGTASLLKLENIPVTEVSDYTQFPEILDGRVKTLHPKIFGGILHRGEKDKDILSQFDITPFDFVIVNLYPFDQVISKENHSFSDAIENIDIGGVSLIRAAAKNHAYVTVIVDNQDYAKIISTLENHKEFTEKDRLDFAKKAFAYTASYDQSITNYLNQDEQPQKFSLNLEKICDLRYGENPHQNATLYQDSSLQKQNRLAQSKPLQGKELSYNNLLDADTALACVKSFADQNACVIVKHANPCGVAIGKNISDAYERAYSCDKTSAFGGIIAFNSQVDELTAKTLLKNQFVEVIIAPSYENAALKLFSDKPNIRILAVALNEYDMKQKYIHSIDGGYLIQQHDFQNDDVVKFKVVTKRHPTSEEKQDLYFAWKVVRFVKSNAIVYAKNNMTYGIGAGQMSRVHSTQIAAIKAAEAQFDLNNAVMASDAFFPFRDNIDLAAKQGITAIIQPGGSIRDEEIIQACDEHNIAMIITGIRHFRH